MELGNQDKSWAAHIVCKPYQEHLMPVGTRDTWTSFQFGILMIWHEPQNHIDDLFLLNWHCWPQQQEIKICDISFPQFSYQTCTTLQWYPDSYLQRLYTLWHWRIGPWMISSRMRRSMILRDYHLNRYCLIKKSWAT